MARIKVKITADIFKQISEEVLSQFFHYGVPVDSVVVDWEKLYVAADRLTIVAEARSLPIHISALSQISIHYCPVTAAYIDGKTIRLIGVNTNMFDGEIKLIR